MQSTARAVSGATIGVEAILVEVEVDLAAQLPAMSTVGLAHAEVKEAKERVRAAVRNTGFKFPARRITVNLAPADVPKTGTVFDLPIAAALLAANGDARRDALAGWVMMGELGLDGGLRPVGGVLPVALAARDAGRGGVIVPGANGPEAAAVDGLDVRVAHTLGEVVAFLNGEHELARARETAVGEGDGRGEPAMRGDPVDLAFVRGHGHARRAVEIAAAGGHNLLMSGTPGAGKTMLARCIPSILPPMTHRESLEVTAIHSVAGVLPEGGRIRTRPFRAPHPSCRPAALLGGGRPLRPGEVSLAHRGVLFLDELPELARDVLEALRGPVEDRVVQLARAGRRVRFPSSFTLVAAMNPCPCGYAGTERCNCAEERIQRYVGRISGPLLDRIDLFARLDPLRGDEFEGPEPESSAAVRERVLAARERAGARIVAAGLEGLACNAELPAQALEGRDLAPVARKMLAEQVDRGMSGRARLRALRVARTLADLEASERMQERHVAEAFSFRPTREQI